MVAAKIIRDIIETSNWAITMGTFLMNCAQGWQARGDTEQFPQVSADLPREGGRLPQRGERRLLPHPLHNPCPLDLREHGHQGPPASPGPRGIHKALRNGRGTAGCFWGGDRASQGGGQLQTSVREKVEAGLPEFLLSLWFPPAAPII